MRNVFITAAAIATIATSAFAGGTADSLAIVPAAAPATAIGGTIGIELTENSAGNYVATTTLGVGINADGLAFGAASVESVDGATFEIDEWFVGARLGVATLTFGKQGDLFVGNDFEIVGGDTIANPASDHESLIVEAGAAAVLVGFSDITTDIGDIENIQGSYSFTTGQIGLTAVADYNIDSENFTVGAQANAKAGQVVLGGIVTYAQATDVFAYEASAGYNFVTAFVNGDNNDAFQNIGAGVTHDFNGLNLYAEGTYNIDTEANSVAAGVSFSF
jgi:hypothetical protein